MDDDMSMMVLTITMMADSPGKVSFFRKASFIGPGWSQAMTLGQTLGYLYGQAYM